MSAVRPLPTADRLARIQALVIPAPTALQLATTLAVPRVIAADPSGREADVDGGSLVSFVAGVSADHRSAALNSTLLAAMNSDTKYNRNKASEVLDWYNNYVSVLQLCGWSAQNFGFQNYQASGSTVSINSAIVEIIAAAVTGPELAVVEAGLDALKNLSTDDPWYKVWDQSTHSENGGNFQIVPVSDSSGARNTLVMQCSAFAFSTSQTTTRFLWVDYNSSDMQLQYNVQTMTLDEDLWDQVSTTVITKLGSNSKTKIGNLGI